MKSLAIIRSEPLSPEHIRECADALEDCYVHFQFKWAEPDPDEGRVPSFIVDQLFDMKDFGTVYAVDTWFHASSFEEYSKVEAIRRVFDADSRVHWRELWNANEYTRDCESACKGPKHNGELSIGCGRSHFGYYCCFDPLDDSPAFKDKQYRKSLFEKAISSIHLQEEIRVYIDDDDKLRMTAEKPWRLSHFASETDGANPSGFNVNGFESAENASQAAVTIIRDIAKSVASGMIRANLPINTYSLAFPKLNGIGSGWRMYITGEWDGPAARPLDDQDFLEAGKPGRYPAFSWWEDVNGPQVIGSVVVEDGTCFLELAAEGASAELLMERAKALDGVSFKNIL